MRLRILALSVLTSCISACGGGATDPPAPADRPRAAEVTITPAAAQLTALGETTRFSARVRDQNGQVMAGATVSWSSGNTSVATVDGSGLATAVGNGTAPIMATSGPASGSATVTVAQLVSAVSVTPAAHTMSIGDTLRLTAEATDRNGSVVAAGTEFAWTSSDTLVATVDGSGLATALAEGEAEIMAGVVTAAGNVAGTSRVTVVSPDRAVLVALYEATGGSDWVANSGWLTDAPLGDWFGVTTDESGRVTGLYLIKNNLNGPIPAELGGLAALTELWLDTNQLTGPIPPELGGLANLTRLVLPSHERAHRPDPVRTRRSRQPDDAVASGERAHRLDPVRTGRPRQPDDAVARGERAHRPDSPTRGGSTPNWAASPT